MNYKRELTWNRWVIYTGLCFSHHFFVLTFKLFQIIGGNWNKSLVYISLPLHPTLFFVLIVEVFQMSHFFLFHPNFCPGKKNHLLIAQLLIDLVLLILKQERTRKEQEPCRNWLEMSQNWPITDQKLPDNDQEREMNRPMPVLGRDLCWKSLNKKCEAKF